MNKTINFSDLKSKRIRKSFDNGIEIYNPSKEEKEQIINIMMNSVDINKQDIKISGEDIIIKLLPILSNIYIDVEGDLLKEIIENPSYELEMAVEEIGKIVNELSDITSKNIKAISSLSTEEVIKLLNIDDKMTDEEILELKRLKEKAEKLGIN